MEITYSARAVYPKLGYKNWENFDNLVKRAESLIASGQSAGVIKKTQLAVPIGSGAVRQIVDYELDEAAFHCVKRLSNGYKTNPRITDRNECAILALLQKYCEAKGIPFVFQQRVGGCIFDAVVGECVAIEFDEPHHAKKSQRDRDAEKNHLALSEGLVILRFTLKDDIVDMILAIEKLL